MLCAHTIPEGRCLRVAFSGKSGCGNTTVTGMLAERLCIAMVNFTFRSLADETGLSLEEIILRAKTDDSFDIAVDTRQVELAKKQSCVLGSRLAIWMLKEADFKVYLAADEIVRAARIQAREGGSLDGIINFTRMRDAEDTARYKKLYGIDNNDYSFADMVIETGRYAPEEIVSLILCRLEEKGLIHAARDKR